MIGLRKNKSVSLLALGALIIFTLTLPQTAAAQRTGAYTAIHSQTSVFGREPVKADGTAPVRDISFEVYAPKNYDPSDPPGVLVFITPVIKGKAPKRLNDVFEEQNLIWVSINGSGDNTEDLERMVEAYGALSYIVQQYRIDRARRYLGGFDDGARVASLFAQDYPHFFNGYLLSGGAAEWQDPDNRYLNIIRRDRFAFVAGEKARNKDVVKDAYESFRALGVKEAAWMEIGDLGHRLPNAEEFSDVIEFLDTGRSD